MFWRGILPRKRQGFADHFFAGFRECDKRCAALTPFSCCRFENCWIRAQKILLLFACELCHSPIEIRAERCKYLAPYAKIRVIHVRTLFRFRKAEGDLAKFVCRHKWNYTAETLRRGVARAGEYNPRTTPSAKRRHPSFSKEGSMRKKASERWNSGAEVFRRKCCLELKSASGQHCFKSGFVDGFYVGVHRFDNAVFDVFE